MKALSGRLGLALGLIAVLMVGGCGDRQQTVALGDIVQGRLGDVDGTEHTLLVPNGELTVVISEGQSFISGTEAADSQERVAPEGTKWVALDWRLDPGEGIDASQRALMEDTSQRTGLTLRTGDETVDLGDAPGSTATPAETRTSGTVYVAIATDGAPVIEVTFDGVTASLDTGTGEVTGDKVEAISDLVPPEDVECPPLKAPKVTADAPCSVTITTVPYLAGRGWSDEGWTVAYISTRFTRFTRGDATYSVQSAEDGSGFDGAKGESVVALERFTQLVARVVAEGSPARLDIVRLLNGLITDGEGPEERTVELTATVDLD